jgi:iron(III) transport system ATP-binding protein
MLSGGERQRVALARALAPRPRVLLMDEPFSSLDERLRDQVRADTTRFLRETRTTTVVVTHDPGEAMRIGDRVVLLREGRVVQSGTPAEMYAGPRSLFAAGFFSELNEIPGICRAGRVETAIGDFAAADVAPGSTARVCIRPEHVRVASHPTPVSGAVTDVTFLGDHEELDVQVPQLPVLLHLHVPPGHHLSRGQRIYLDIDPTRILIFASAPH